MANLDRLSNQSAVQLQNQQTLKRMQVGSPSKSGVVFDVQKASSCKLSAEKKSALSPEKAPVLQKPKQPLPPSSLENLAKAFSKAYESMTSHLADDLTNLEDSERNMSHAVLKAQIDYLKIEHKQAGLLQKIADRQKAAKFFGKWSNIVSIVLPLITTFAGIVLAPETGGASLALAEAGEEALEEGAIAGLAEGAEPIAAALEEGAEAAANLGVDAGEGQLANAQEAAIQAGPSKAVRSAKWLFKKLVQASIGSTAAMPQFWRGMQSIRLTGPLSDLAKSQHMSGTAQADVTKLKAAFDFCQKLVQQTTNVAEQRGQEASDIGSTFSDVCNAYKQVTYGLAQAI